MAVWGNDVTSEEKWKNRQPFSQRMFGMAANGNQAAYNYLMILFEAVSITDDLQDKDVESAPNALAKLFMLFSALLANPFCRANGEALSSLMTTGAVAWDVSNKIEGATDYAKRIEQVVFYVALVCGGYQLAHDVAQVWITESKD